MQQLLFFPTLTEKYGCCIQQLYFSIRVVKEKYCCCIKKQQKNTFFVILSTEEKAITTEKNFLMSRFCLNPILRYLPYKPKLILKGKITKGSTFKSDKSNKRQ